MIYKYCVRAFDTELSEVRDICGIVSGANFPDAAKTLCQWYGTSLECIHYLGDVDPDLKYYSVIPKNFLEKIEWTDL